MDIRPTSVPGAWVCTPRIFDDSRGSFLEWFRGDELLQATGRRFDVVQANHSTSHRGVVRGLHFADVPPGQAKYVYCPVGAALDVILDVRVGSPSFGAVETVLLDDADRRGVFVAEGLGHAFCALRDGTAVTYLLSTTYDPSAERTVTPADPALALPWPSDVGPLLLSEKDTDGPTLEEAQELGLLPSFEACTARYAELAP